MLDITNTTVNDTYEVDIDIYAVARTAMTNSLNESTELQNLVKLSYSDAIYEDLCKYKNNISNGIEEEVFRALVCIKAYYRYNTYRLVSPRKIKDDELHQYSTVLSAYRNLIKYNLFSQNNKCNNMLSTIEFLVENTIILKSLKDFGEFEQQKERYNAFFIVLQRTYDLSDDSIIKFKRYCNDMIYYINTNNVDVYLSEDDSID